MEALDADSEEDEVPGGLELDGGNAQCCSPVIAPFPLCISGHIV